MTFVAKLLKQTKLIIIIYKICSGAYVFERPSKTTGPIGLIIRLICLSQGTPLHALLSAPISACGLAHLSCCVQSRFQIDVYLIFFVSHIRQERHSQQSKSQTTISFCKKKLNRRPYRKILFYQFLGYIVFNF